MIVLDNVSFSYGYKTILEKLCLELDQGQIATLIGGSGSGKSTLFKLLTGLLYPHEGKILIAQQSSVAQQIAYMTQEDLLLPWRTVLQNMTLSTELGSNKKDCVQTRKEAFQLLEDLNLGNCADLFPHQLSGGMRQRVSLARALLQKRPVLLLDEPFGSLDVSLREQVYSLLREIQKKKNTTIFMVTHDFRDALALSDCIFLMSEGKITQKWTLPDDIRNDPVKATLLQEELRKAICIS